MDYEKQNKIDKMRKQGTEPAWIDSSPSLGRTRSTEGKSKPSKAELDNLEIGFLWQVVHFELCGGPEPKAPKKIRERLEKKVNKRGSSIAWAKTHPEYSKVLGKKRKRIRKKYPNKRVV